jgi:hypothetical protein
MKSDRSWKKNRNKIPQNRKSAKVRLIRDARDRIIVSSLYDVNYSYYYRKVRLRASAFYLKKKTPVGKITAGVLRKFRQYGFW